MPGQRKQIIPLFSISVSMSLTWPQIKGHSTIHCTCIKRWNCGKSKYTVSFGNVR